MTHNDEFHVKERITALHEAHGKTVTSRSLALYWEALSVVGRDDFDAAIVRAMRTGALKAHELLQVSRECQRERVAANVPATGIYRCNAHEAEPDVISPNDTMSWCDRCQHFVGLGRQDPDRFDEQKSRSAQ